MAPSRGTITTASRGLIRTFSTSRPHLSGHNRWSKIRHEKASTDLKKNRQRSQFAQEITTASKLFGPEPANNPRLADLITKAKKEGFAKASIEAAILRGQGKSTSGASLESVTVEGILPNNVAVICDCETESRLRTLMEAKLAIKNAGGVATPCAYLFEKQGRIVFEPKEGVGVDEVLETALEAGATDVEDGEEGEIMISCEPSDTASVSDAVSSGLGLVVKTSEIVWSPNADTKVAVPSDAAAKELTTFVDNLLDKENTVQAISMNITQGSISDEAWSDLESRLTY